MNLAELQRNWDTFGRTDPFWAILTDPSKRRNRWSPAEFFETGRTEIAEVMSEAARLGVPRGRARALDFGCGAGRLTQALGEHFDAVVGVDVAPSMIELARAHNRHGELCCYEVNDRPDLSRWPDASFDLIYTSRVLQHIEPRYATAYVGEFVRLLAPGGYLSFDLPSASGDAAAIADGTLPASAMRARLSASPSGKLAAAAGTTVRFSVTVVNESDVVWHDVPGRELNVGNQWLDARGDLVRMDDERVRLPTPLPPGTVAAVTMDITMPDEPGEHRLQFDVVQEGVAWFASCDSRAANIVVRVTDNARSAAPTATDPVPTARHSVELPAHEGEVEPVMEMHAVPRDEVETILASAGARLVEVRRVYHCGPQWLAFRYDVTK